MTDLNRALAEALELGLKLKVGAYPAHGDGFVVILTEGNFDEFQTSARQALASLPALEARAEHQRLSDGWHTANVEALELRSALQAAEEERDAERTMRIRASEERADYAAELNRSQAEVSRLREIAAKHACDCSRCCVVHQWQQPNAECPYFQLRAALDTSSKE